MEPIIGQVIHFAGESVPRGWLKCDGRLLEIETYAKLYSIIGNKYGGDGKATFALPNLRFSRTSFLAHNRKEDISSIEEKKNGFVMMSIIAIEGTYPSFT